MPRVDFSDVGDVHDFSPVPVGRYVCRVAKVEEASTQNGDEMWRLWHEVAEGEYEGRFIFDNLVFSESALGRAKHICRALGFDVASSVDVTPTLVEGRICKISVEIEDYVANDGQTKKKNKVLYAGYEPVVSVASAPENARNEPLPI